MENARRVSDERPHTVYMRSNNRNAVYDRQTHRSPCELGDGIGGQFIDRRVSDDKPHKCGRAITKRTRDNRVVLQTQQLQDLWLKD